MKEDSRAIASRQARLTIAKTKSALKLPWSTVRSLSIGTSIESCDLVRVTSSLRESEIELGKVESE